jgi:hypothetical protein
LSKEVDDKLAIRIPTRELKDAVRSKVNSLFLQYKDIINIKWLVNNV